MFWSPFLTGWMFWRSCLVLKWVVAAHVCLSSSLVLDPCVTFFVSGPPVAVTGPGADAPLHRPAFWAVAPQQRTPPSARHPSPGHSIHWQRPRFSLASSALDSHQCVSHFSLSESRPGQASTQSQSYSSSSWKRGNVELSGCAGSM